MADESIYLKVDERGYDISREMATKAGRAQAEVKGLIRVVRKLGHILKQVDPDNEFLNKTKVDEVYYDTKLEIPSPFK